MAKNTSSSKPRRAWSTTKFLDCVAYFAIMFIAVAIILRLVFKNTNGNIVKTCTSIGECLAYILCIWLGFYWTMRKKGSGWNNRNVWWLVCWIIASVVIVVVYVLALI